MGETNNAKSNAEILSRIMDDILLKGNLEPQNHREYFRRVAQEVVHQGVMWDEDVVMDHWSWLQRLGVVVVTHLHPAGVVTSYPGGIKVPELYVSDRGRLLLQSGEAAPHNPAGFYGRIRSQIASPDGVVMTYLDEAVGAWGAGLYRATAVMIGCACEQLILLLAESISKANVLPYSERITKDLEKMTKSPVSVSTLFDKVRDALLVLAGDKKLPGDVADALDRKLTPIFEYTRALRNTGGHPTAVPVTNEDAEAALLLFPGFYFFVNDVMVALAKPPTA